MVLQAAPIRDAIATIKRLGRFGITVLHRWLGEIVAGLPYKFHERYAMRGGTQQSALAWAKHHELDRHSRQHRKRNHISQQQWSLHDRKRTHNRVQHTSGMQIDKAYRINFIQRFEQPCHRALPAKALSPRAQQSWFLAMMTFTATHLHGSAVCQLDIVRCHHDLGLVVG